MSVGYPAGKNEIDMRAGGLVQQLRDNLAAITTFNTWLAATPDATLTALGYTTGEVATLKSGIGDLATLAALARGTGTQAAAKDSFQFAKLLVGVS